MSNIVEIILEIKDFLSGGMIKAAQISSNANNTIATSSAAATTQINTTAMAVKNLAKQYSFIKDVPIGNTFARTPMSQKGQNYNEIYAGVHEILTNVKNKVVSADNSLHGLIGTFANVGIKGVTHVASFGKSVGEIGVKTFTAAKQGITGIVNLGRSFVQNTGVVGLMKNNIEALMGGTTLLEVVQNAVGGSTELWTAAQEILNIVLEANPIGIVIGVIFALVKLIKTACDHNKYWAQSLKDLWSVIKIFAHIVMITFKGVGETIWYYIQYGWLKMKSFVQWSVEAMSQVGKSIKLALSGDWDGAKTEFNKQIKTTGQVEIDAITVQHNADDAANTKAMGAYTKDIVKSWNSMAANVKTGWEKRNEKGTDPTVAAKEAKEKTDKAKAAKEASANAKLAHGVNQGHNAGASDKANAITSGGSKSIIINIQEMGNNMVVTASGVKETATEVGKTVVEQVLRILSSEVASAH